VALPQALTAAHEAILSGEPVDAALAAAKDAIGSAGFSSIDYVALVDAGSLEPLDQPRGAMRLIAAATIGGTRLIDNIAVETAQSPQA
jgi:pantoate--beta-alanine ligase